MKKLALALALLALPIYANATGREATHNQAANMLQGQAQYQNQTGGNSSVNVDSERNAAASAIAPSVGTNNNCLIATPSSAAVNILFGGVSKTTGFHYSGLCLAYRMNDMALVEKLMCLEDSNYAKLNPNCKGK